MVRILTVALVGLGVGAAQAEVPRVAVDIAPVHSIVAAVMGDLGTPDLVMPAGASPHDHQLRPSEARALDRADVIVWVGPSLTPWLVGPAQTLGGDAVTVTLLEVPGTELLEVRQGPAFGAHDHDHGGGDDHAGHEDGHAGHEDDHAGHADDHAGHDHDHGHDKEHAEHKKDHAAHDHDARAHEDAGHGRDHEETQHDHAGHGQDVFDPHAWLDPRNAALWAQAIAATLSAKDPENAGIYTANATGFAAAMTVLEAEIEARLTPVRGRGFVVFHDAYHYFEHRFGIEALGAVSENDATAPSAGRMSQVQQAMADVGAVCALTEPQFNPGLLNALGPVRLGEIDPLGASLELGVALYPDMLRQMTTALADCLQ